ncbi:MAG: prolipoprotein diacylglyceryl transferase family protein, partial [Pseudomonadota bacterium]
EAFLEGLLLFAVLWWVARKPRATGLLSGLFLIGYSLSRMLVELVRVPDDHLDYLYFNWVTMGHVLSLPMLLLGLYLVFNAVSTSTDLKK